MTGFYRYAISRGYADRWPLPAPESEPRTTFSAPPYVFTHEEFQRLLGTIDISRWRAVQFDGDTLRAFLLLLFGSGLRFAYIEELIIEI